MGILDIPDKSRDFTLSITQENYHRRNVVNIRNLTQLDSYCEFPHNIIISGISTPQSFNRVSVRSELTLKTVRSIAPIYSVVFFSGNVLNCQSLYNSYYNLTNVKSFCKSRNLGNMEPFSGLNANQISEILVELGRSYFSFTPSTELYAELFVRVLSMKDTNITLDALYNLSVDEVLNILVENSDENQQKQEEDIDKLSNEEDYSAFHAMIYFLAVTLLPNRQQNVELLSDLLADRIPIIVNLDSVSSRDNDILFFMVSRCVEFMTVNRNDVYFCYDSIQPRYYEILKNNLLSYSQNVYWLVSTESFPKVLLFDDSLINTVWSGKIQTILFRHDGKSAKYWSDLFGDYNKISGVINEKGISQVALAPEKRIPEDYISNLVDEQSIVKTPTSDTIFIVGDSLA